MSDTNADVAAPSTRGTPGTSDRGGVEARASGSTASRRPEPLDIELWRFPAERVELVERLVNAERARGLLERALREIAEQEGDRSLGAYVIALLAQNVILEQNVNLLSRRKKAA